ncbi:MAG: stage III sporulation protein AE [Ruminococcaceae bacterium]|nr:stage III sporulation protein AE [Oscillospiraceae bacterium]
MKRCLMVLAILLVMLQPCRADQLSEQLGTDELIKAGQAYDTGVEFSQDLELEAGANRLLERAAQLLPELIRDAVRGGLLLLVVVLLCGMAQAMHTAGGQSQLPVPVMAGALAITALSAGDVSMMLGLGRKAIEEMHGFGNILVPVMAACTAAGGNVGAAAARQVATVLFSNLLMTVIDRLLVPMVYVFIATLTAYAAVGNPGLKRVAEFLKWAVKTVLTALTSVFVAYLTVSGAVAGSADAAAVKVTKTAISTVIPVVGGIISNAAETILVGAGALRGAVGVFGLLAVLGLCLSPFLQLGVHYITYKLSSAVAATLAEGRLSELIGGIGTAFGLIFSMAGCCALLLLVSIACGISGGSV